MTLTHVAGIWRHIRRFGRIVEKLATPAGRAAYAERKWLSEAPHGWIKHVLGFRAPAEECWLRPSPLLHACRRHHHPRRNRSVLASLASRPLATVPVFRAGRLPHPFGAPQLLCTRTAPGLGGRKVRRCELAACALPWRAATGRTRTETGRFMHGTCRGKVNRDDGLRQTQQRPCGRCRHPTPRDDRKTSVMARRSPAASSMTNSNIRSVGSPRVTRSLSAGRW